MKKIKKCYVLIFALILGLAPQAICWYFEPEFSAQVTFPLFLFHNTKDIFLIESDITFNLSSVFGDQTVFRNNITLVNSLVLPMVLSYSYILTATIVLGEYIYHIISKKILKRFRKLRIGFLKE